MKPAQDQEADQEAEMSGAVASEVSELAGGEPANSTDAPADPSDAAGASEPAPRRRRVWRICFWSLGCTSGFALLFAALVFWLIGREMDVPDWVHTRLEARLSQMLPAGQVRFDDLKVELGTGIRPRVTLHGVEIDDDQGRQMVLLDALTVRLATDPLFDGQLRLGRLQVSGAEMVIRRLSDGSFDIAFGNAVPAVGTGASPAEIVAEIDNWLQSDELRHVQSVIADGVILRYEDARVGRAWTVDGGRVDLTRDGDDLRLRGDLSVLGGHEYVTTIETTFDSRIGETAARFGMLFEDMAGPDIALQSAAVAWLGAVQAPISGALRGSLNEDGSLGAISGTLQTAGGAIQPSPQAKPVPFRSARSYFTYDPAGQILRFDDLAVDSDWIALEADGQATLRGMEGGLPQGFEGQFRLSKLSAAPEDYLADPIAVDQALMSFQLDLDPFALTLGELALTAEGQTIVAQGRAEVGQAGWALSLSAQAQTLDVPALLRMWPETLKPKSRTWVAENIYETTVTNGHFAFRKPADGDAQTYASFEFADTRLRYSRKLPVVEQAHGHAVLEGNRFTAVADGGYLTPPEGGQIDVTGTSFVIPDIRIKPAPAEVSLAASGKLRAALSLLNLPPLSVLDKAGRDLDLASGEVVARGELRMPLRKKLPPDLLRFQVAAVLSDVASTTLVKDRQLRADRLELRVDNDRMVITGPGTLEGVPFDAVYESSLKKADRGKAQLTGSIEISNRALDAFNIDLPKGTLRGVGRGQMDVTLQKGRPPEFQLTSDLAGVGLSLPPLYWSLPQSRNGSLTVAGRLSKPAQINTLSLEAAGLRARGALSLRPDGGMKELTLSQLQAGRWLDAKVTLKGRGKGKTPEVLLQGGTVDLRHVPKAGERASQRQASASGAVTPLSGGLDQLRISDSLRLTNLAGQFLAGRGLNGDFTAQVNGQAPVNGTVYSAGSRSAYELRSPDAGAVFKAAGLMKQARGGEMILRLTEVDTPGHYDGELNVTGTRVIEVPVLASLLHAVSVVGLVEQMAAGGILFSNVEARFRLTPDRLILSRASAVGASMGLSIDGYYDLKERQMDFQGVLSPVYMVNGIGSLLTRKGEGLIGFNYLLRGRGDDPRVIVNPLSLFTPGMFREIFRRPPPKVDQ